jgi:hypothetical protein
MTEWFEGLDWVNPSTVSDEEVRVLLESGHAVIRKVDDA